MIWSPNLNIWTPPVIGPMDISPSPPAEQRDKARREIERNTRPLRNRDMCPGAWQEWEQSVMPAAIVRHRRSMKPAGGLAITAPTAFYRLEDATDSSGNGLNLTNNGSVTFGAPSKIGNAGNNFAGTARNLSHLDVAQFDPGASPFSICAWAYSTNLAANNQSVVTKDAGGGSNQQYRLLYRGPTFNNAFQFGASASGTATTSVTWSSSASINTWYFLAAWADGANLNLSVNAGAAVQTAFSSTVFAGSAAFEIGGPYDGWTGSIDAVGWWKGYALTSADVTALYNSGAGAEYFSGAWH